MSEIRCQIYISDSCLLSSVLLELLSQRRCLAPADDLHGWKAILVNQTEVLVSLAQYFPSWMRLEAKQDFEESSCWGRSPAGNVQQVPARHDHTREFRHALIKRHIFERAAR